MFLYYEFESKNNINYFSVKYSLHVLYTETLMALIIVSTLIKKKGNVT